VAQTHAPFARNPADGASGAVSVPIEPVDPERPFVLAIDGSGGPRVAALNNAAEKFGLGTGDRLADARARAGALQVRPLDPAADEAALQRLALWATRYTPAVSPWSEENGADGLSLDVTGAVHLFGNEENLLADLLRRLERFSLPARAAIADTAGAAWALSHFHASSRVVLPAGREAEALAPLPVAALRLSPDTRTTLRRLGFKRCADIIDKPRAPFAARFETELLRRIDQGLGRAPEPLAFIAPPPAYHILRHLIEPIVTQEAIVIAATRLMQDLVPHLAKDGVGARSLRLALYRVDGDVATVDIGLTRPTCNPSHVARLIDLKLERIVETIDAGFGFETVSLTVTAAEPMPARQSELIATFDRGDNAERVAGLIDSLRQRLGPRSVRQLRPVASHMPERAEASSEATGETHAWPPPDDGRPRPLLLLPQAERADVIALVPEGPPQRFRWRGAVHRVAHAQGPERIASEWWRHRTPQPTRDYYLVEDKAGRRFWLYREGLYGRETAAPRWFVHGLFA
jgi:protein ImuB